VVIKCFYFLKWESKAMAIEKLLVILKELLANLSANSGDMNSNEREVAFIDICAVTIEIDNEIDNIANSNRAVALAAKKSVEEYFAQAKGLCKSFDEEIILLEVADRIRISTRKIKNRL